MNIFFIHSYKPISYITKVIRTVHQTHMTDQVKSLLNVLSSKPLSALECMEKLKLSHRPTFRKNYLNPALAAGRIERTIPDKPNSRLQKYMLL